ncbi:MAG: helix-turn-helix transcriptional regulator, partial [Alphaproteobacteria bacterium]
MARFETDSEARRLGEALAALRRACGLSQAEAGRRAGMTGQGWGLYEAGKRPGLFRPDVQRRLTMAIGAAPAALGAPPAGGRPPGVDEAAPGVRSPAEPWEGPPSAPVRRLQLSDDDLAPWAASGVVLEYVPGRWPRRGQGCVVETSDGRL